MAVNGTIPEVRLRPISWPLENLLCNAAVPIQDCRAREGMLAGSTTVSVQGSAESAAEVTTASKRVAQDMVGSKDRAADNDDAESGNTFDGLSM